MARKAKIDNAIKKRFDRTEKKRAINTRNKLAYFLIVCEGEKTEPNYFNAFEKELPVGTVELRIEGTGRNTLGLIDFTIEQRNMSNRKYDRVWAVFDIDDFPDNKFNSAITKASANNIQCAWSNEAFELWYLLHFQFVNTRMSRDKYEKFLEREIKNKSGIKKYEYKKNDPGTFSLLKKYGNQMKATEWAKRLVRQFSDERFATHNPCTLVYKLIEELRNPSEVLNSLEENESGN